MEKLVLITGIDAFEELKSINLSSLSNQFEITYEQAPLKIAAFIGIEHLNGILDKYNNENLNHWFIVSGLIPWDLNLIEGKFTGRVRKGPKFLSNLKETLTKIHPSQLSSLNPADKLIKYDTRNEFNHHIARVKEQISAQIASGQERDGFSISPRFPNVIFSELLPPLIVAEIVDAPQFSDEEIVEKVRYFLDSGADVIDLGCMANKDHSVRITELVKLIRDNFDCPISIDSLNVNEIKAAVDAGVDLVLSITADNLSSLKGIPKDISLVVVPVEDSKKETTVNGRMAKVVMIGNRLNVAGYKKILLDPVLDPAFKPGLSESLETYFLLSDAIHSIPTSDLTPMTFMGIGNVTELTDSDSQGINTILAILAVENGVAGILTTEYSNKVRGSIKELRNAIDLAYWAKIKNQAPINLGINAFRAKGKQKYARSNYKDFDNAEIIDLMDEDNQPIELDKTGFFKVYVHYQERQIIVEFFKNEKNDEPKSVYIGNNPLTIYKKVIRDGLIGEYSHAAYLGKELTKAYYALEHGSDYIQDGI